MFVQTGVTYSHTILYLFIYKRYRCEAGVKQWRHVDLELQTMSFVANLICCKPTAYHLVVVRPRRNKYYTRVEHVFDPGVTSV